MKRLIRWPDADVDFDGFWEQILPYIHKVECWFCGTKIPGNYTYEEVFDGDLLPKGWQRYTQCSYDMNSAKWMAFACPNCDLYHPPKDFEMIFENGKPGFPPPPPEVIELFKRLDNERTRS